MIELSNIVFQYKNAEYKFRLKSLSISNCESVSIIGPSGCGKTTLLRLVSGILVPESGQIKVGGRVLGDMSHSERSSFRIREIGMVFQEFELLDYLTVRDNILLPYRVSNALLLTGEVSERAEQLADATGIAILINRYPRELSQGERQRVALCRALITQPKLILADEPTGSLDPDSQARVVELMCSQAREHKATLVMVTHDREILSSFERCIELPLLLGEE